MSSWWTFIFGLILISVWVVSGGFLTQANVFLTGYKNKDGELDKAYNYTFWAAFILWFIVALFVLLLFLSIVGVVALFGSGAGEVAEAESVEERNLVANSGTHSPSGYGGSSWSWTTVIFFLVVFVLVLITGGLAAAAFVAIGDSPNFNTSDSKLKTAYDDCSIAAVISILTAVILIVGFLTYMVTRYEYSSPNQSLYRERVELAEKEKKIKIQERRLEQARQKLITEENQYLAKVSAKS